MISTEPGSSTPCLAATSRISSGFPRRTQRAIPRAPTIAAAATVRGSVPSGRTMRRMSERAASMSRYRKAGGETRATRDGWAKPFTQAGSTWSAMKFIVRSTRS